MPLDDQGRSYPEDEVFTNVEWILHAPDGVIFQEENFAPHWWQGRLVELTWFTEDGVITHPTIFTSIELENAGLRLRIRSDLPTWAQELVLPNGEVTRAHIEFQFPPL